MTMVVRESMAAREWCSKAETLAKKLRALGHHKCAAGWEMLILSVKWRSRISQTVPKATLETLHRKRKAEDRGERADSLCSDHVTRHKLDIDSGTRQRLCRPAADERDNARTEVLQCLMRRGTFDWAMFMASRLVLADSLGLAAGPAYITALLQRYRNPIGCRELFECRLRRILRQL